MASESKNAYRRVGGGGLAALVRCGGVRGA